MHFFQSGQRGIDGVLRHHAGGAVELQNEADGHVGGDGGRAERVEAVAGGAREQFAMPAEPRRARRNGVQHLFGHRQFGGLQRVGQGVQRLALVGGGLPLHGRAAIAAHGVDVVLPATMEAADSTE